MTITTKILSPLALILIAAIILLANCRHGMMDTEPEPEGLPKGTSFLEPSSQRSGDPATGYQYLIYGDYVGSGIPLQVFKQFFGSNSPDDLGRTGDADGVPFRYNVITASNGVKVVAPTCLTCHAEKLNGQLIVGLGNNTADYTANQATMFQTADLAVKFLYGQNSPEWNAYYPASRASQAIGPYILTKTRGVNPADKIFAALSAHRKQDDLAWIDVAQSTIPVDVVPTDVPAWWLMKKKNALYYNGLGRGDFARLSTASGMLTMLDSSEARLADQKFPDLMAWIRSIEAPAYPYAIDQSLAAQGKELFERNCSKCHGTYGAEETYPNLLVQLSTIRTDTLLSHVYQLYPQYHTWYNSSWYAQGTNKAQLLPNNGYVAPPLDGIWATAPYLHNASVPTLDDLLFSGQRPTYWKRSFDNSDYNQQKLGWNYTKEVSKTDINTYDTTLPGYGNGGHTFGDVLTDNERKAVLEYLKTL
ncbi:MAG: c-type cytochrome [Saprospiraceae bacterium]|nr:c-type cytochrome [Saprospiraceae bacterium]